MKPDGEFWSEMTSHDTRYPYFYQVSSLDHLMSNMRESIRAHGKKMMKVVDDQTVYVCIDIEASGPVPGFFQYGVYRWCRG